MRIQLVVTLYVEDSETPPLSAAQVTAYAKDCVIVAMKAAGHDGFEINDKLDWRLDINEHLSVEPLVSA